MNSESETEQLRRFNNQKAEALEIAHERIKALLARNAELLEACKAAEECIVPTGLNTKSDRALEKLSKVIRGH